MKESKIIHISGGTANVASSGENHFVAEIPRTHNLLIKYFAHGYETKHMIPNITSTTRNIMSTTKEEYDLLIAMLAAFKQLGGDAEKWSFPAWKGMSDECTSFFYKKDKADKTLLGFIRELTKLESVLCIDETEDALYKGVLLTGYCLLKKYNKHAALLGGYLYKKAELYGFEKIIIKLSKLNDLRGECDMNNEIDSNIITLNDENGNEVDFEFLDLIEYTGEEFIVLLPCTEADEAGEVVILKVEDTDDENEESYIGVDDESVLNAVFEIIREKFKDEFNFVD